MLMTGYESLDCCFCDLFLCNHQCKYCFFCTYCPENLKQINLSVIFHWTCLSDCLLFDLNSWMSWDTHQCLCIFPSMHTESVYCISMRNWACDLCVVYWLYIVITKLEMYILHTSRGQHLHNSKPHFRNPFLSNAAAENNKQLIKDVK